MTIDPRLKERRIGVAEDRAKRNMGRLLRFLIAILVVGGGVWLMYSPWLSVSQVQTTGISQSDANHILATHDVVAGSPMFTIDADSVVEYLLADPWVANAEVTKEWPSQVTVVISERTPVAWSHTASGWTRRALDGVAVPSLDSPDQEFGRIDMPSLTAEDAESSPQMIGALEFIAALNPGLRTGAIVTVDASELWATVSGFQVRLGRPVEMEDKAIVLEALLRKPIPPGSVLILIAPTNPSVSSPDMTTDDETEGQSDSEGVDGDGVDG